jgi:hypothetical protein
MTGGEFSEFKPPYALILWYSNTLEEVAVMMTLFQNCSMSPSVSSAKVN